MNNNDILKLKAALSTGKVLWYPDKDTAREVLRIAPGRVPVIDLEDEDGNVDTSDAEGLDVEREPSDEQTAEADAEATVTTDCAHLTRGDYLALVRCDLDDFVVVRGI